MADSDHRTLAEALEKTQGMVLLSGYKSGLYEELYGHWHQVERETYADGARARTEVLWLNHSAERHLRKGLFD